jgi:protein-arginine kinase activator protein McsA
MEQCSKCQRDLIVGEDVSDYSVRARICKPCAAERRRGYYRDKEHVREAAKKAAQKWQLENYARHLANLKKWLLEHPGKRAEYNRTYYLKQKALKNQGNIDE